LQNAKEKARKDVDAEKVAALKVGQLFFKPVRDAWKQLKAKVADWGSEESALIETAISTTAKDKMIITETLEDYSSTGDAFISSSSIRLQVSDVDAVVGNKIYSVGNTLSIILNYIMKLYDRLHRVDYAEELILFPKGVLTFPGEDITESLGLRKALYKRLHSNFRNLSMTHRPLIAFDCLSEEEGWSNLRPPAENIDSYLQQILRAVEVINAAKVCHLDLRPSNIMWRIVPGTYDVEIRVIDFEDSVFFGEVIPENFIAEVYDRNDFRYPFCAYGESEKPKETLAVEQFNTFFYLMIKGWLQESFDPIFDNFMMYENGEALYIKSMNDLFHE
jgi:hypothetical protein